MREQRPLEQVGVSRRKVRGRHREDTNHDISATRVRIAAGRRDRGGGNPGDRSASLRAALRPASGDGETLDQANAELHRLTTPVSLDMTVGHDGDATLGDLMANEGTPEDAVMSMVDGERKSFREVGESLGVRHLP